MSTVRRLVDLLDAPALVALLDKRQFFPGRSNEERRQALSRSYRGKVGSFLEDLRREDLLTILDRRFVLRGVRYRSTSLRGKSREELLKIAHAAFVRAELSSEFEEEIDQKEFVLDATSQEHDDEDAFASEEDESSGTAHESASESPQVFANLSNEWSRPRMISRILAALGHDVPERLRQPRFAEMVKALGDLGLDIADVNGNHLSARDDTPGINAKLRLRRNASRAGDVAEARETLCTVQTTSLGWGTDGHPMLALVTCHARSVPYGQPLVETGARIEAARFAEDLIVRLLPELGGVHLTQPANFSFTVEPAGFDEGSENTVDLGFALAVLGALSNGSAVAGTVALGDVTTDGRIISLRPLELLVRLIATDARVQTVLVPHSSFDECPDDLLHIDLIPVETLADAAPYALANF